MLSDIKAKTVSEEYTPLHLAACYLRHASKLCKSAAKPTEITNQPPKENETLFINPDDDQPDDSAFTETETDATKATETDDLLHVPKRGETMSSRRTQSDAATSDPSNRRRSSVLPIEQPVSCKEIFKFFVERQEIDVCIGAWLGN